MKEDKKDLLISRKDLQALESLVFILQKNYDTAEENLRSRSLRLDYAMSIISEIKKKNLNHSLEG